VKLSAWSISDIGLVRESNQDIVGCFPEIQLFIVADGLGGHSGGEIASAMALQIIQKAFARPLRYGTGVFSRMMARLGQRPEPAHADAVAVLRDRARLEAAIRRANQRIFDVGRQTSQDSRDSRRTLGTTVVALKIAPNLTQACWAHVGDSRLYRVRHGELVLLTADHTIYGQHYLNSPIVPLDIRHTNQLIQALGTTAEVQVATSSAPLMMGDMFLLCSDGVSSLVSPASIFEKLRSSDTLEDAGSSLIRLAMDAGGKDNASLVLVKVVG